MYWPAYQKPYHPKREIKCFFMYSNDSGKVTGITDKKKGIA